MIKIKNKYNTNNNTYFLKMYEEDSEIETDSESDSDINTQMLDVLEEMIEFDEAFDYQEKNNLEYFIGIYIQLKHVDPNRIHQTNPVFGMAVSPQLFFKYELKYIKQYLVSTIGYDINIYSYRSNIDIMQLYILNTGVYSVIIKTYWIKLIQRHWKTIMKERKEFTEIKKKFKNIRQREILGYKMPRIHFPTLRGMLSIYNHK